MQQISPGAWQVDDYSPYSGLAQSLAQGMKLGAMPRQMKQESQQRELQNALSKILVQYAPQNAEADLQGKMLGNSLKQNEVNYAPQMSQATLAELLASTQGKQIANQYAPLDEAIKIQMAQQKSDRFGDAYQLSVALKNMDPATRALWISQNQQEYTDMVNTMAQKASAGATQGTDKNDLLGSMIGKYFPQAAQGQNAPPPTGNLPISPKQIEALKQAMQQPGGQQMPAQGQPNQGFQSSPEQVQALGQASLMAANNKLTTAATRRQMEGAIQVEDIINDPGLQSKAVSAAQYAGAAGKGDAALAALSQKNPQAYEDYLSFVNQDMVLLQNRIKTLDQMGATDSQREELQGLYKKTMDSLTSNPEQFITQFNNLGKSLNRIASSVQKSATPLGSNNRLQGFNPIGTGKARTYNPATGELE
jgi:hypothetical protein